VIHRIELYVCLLFHFTAPSRCPGVTQAPLLCRALVFGSKTPTRLCVQMPAEQGLFLDCVFNNVDGATGGLPSSGPPIFKPECLDLSVPGFHPPGTPRFETVLYGDSVCARSAAACSAAASCEHSFGPPASHQTRGEALATDLADLAAETAWSACLAVCVYTFCFRIL